MPIIVAEHPERLGLRLAPEIKQKAQRAAEASGLSLSDFSREAINDAATEALRPRAKPLRRRPGT